MKVRGGSYDHLIVDSAAYLPERKLTAMFHRKLYHWIAVFLFRVLKRKPRATTNIAGYVEIGYGELHPLGFWKYPLRTED